MCGCSLERKLPLASEALELVWLHHELGRCYLECRRPVKALEHGEKALVNAETVEDDAWLLNAHVLIAHAHGQPSPYTQRPRSAESVHSTPTSSTQTPTIS